VCFITSSRGRRGFLSRRLDLRPGRVVDETGEVGSVDAVELVTVGQRRGLGLAGGGEPQYVVDVDVPRATVRVGSERELLTDGLDLDRVVWAAGPVTGPLTAQCSAHGRPRAVSVEPAGVDASAARLTFEEPQRRVAAGQSVVLYDGDEVVGGGLVTHVTD
jgi:tRNA-specific 2-thiouridylase